MSLINRISSGLVFRDTFESDTLDPMWQVSPNDETRYSLTERPGVLRLKHGSPDLFMLINSPRFDHVFEADTDYDPIRASDQGGIVAFRDKDTRIELLEYYDPAISASITFGKIRMVRRGDLFEGYGSNDNGKTWELIGVSYLAAPKIGLTLKGIREGQSDTMDVLEVKVYRDTMLHIGNLIPGMSVKLKSETNTVIQEGTCKDGEDYVKLDSASQVFPIKGKIEIYDTTGLLVDTTTLLDDIWGGDVFWYGVKLDVEVDTVLLRQDREFQLGNMQAGAIERRIFVVNNNDIPIYNVRAAIQSYSEYIGWEWADLATDTFGQPGTYQDTVFIGHLNPGDKVPVWLKIQRRPYQQIASLNDYKFRISFESG